MGGLELGLVQMALLLLLLFLAFCLLLDHRASLDPLPRLIVVLGQACVEILVLQMPVSWLRHFLVLVLGTDRLSLAAQLLASIPQCFALLPTFVPAFLPVFWLLGPRLVLASVSLER